MKENFEANHYWIDSVFTRKTNDYNLFNIEGIGAISQKAATIFLYHLCARIESLEGFEPTLRKKISKMFKTFAVFHEDEFVDFSMRSQMNGKLNQPIDEILKEL